MISLPSDVPGTSFQLDTFPLHVGNQWLYKVLHQTSTSTIVASGNGSTAPNVSAVDTSYLTIAVTADIVVNGFRFARLAGNNAGSLRYFSFGDDNCYYSNMPDGLHRYYDLSVTDSLHLLDSSSTIVKRPPVFGSSWNTTYGVRQWLGGFVQVTTPAGTFDCIKMHYTSNGPTFNADQYYSQKGLIQESQYFYEEVSVSPGVHEARTSTTVLILESVNF